MPRHLDLAVLRSFLLIAEGRTFAEVGDLVGRSPSAISLQMQKLEAEVGDVVLRRHAREATPTLAGERLLAYARRLVGLNDEALLACRPDLTARPLRLATTQDFAETALPDLLRRFALEHPRVELTLRIDRSRAVLDALHVGEVDVAVAIARDHPASRGRLLEVPMLWIGSAGMRPEAERALPLVLFDPPCTFRTAALDSLAAAGRAARIALTSPSLAGLRAAVAAGVGVTVRTRHLLAAAPAIADVGQDLHLPPLPTVAFDVHARADDRWPAREDLIELCRRTF